MQPIVLLLPLLLLVTPAIAHATNEGSSKFGIGVGFSDYNHCFDNGASDCSPPDNDAPLRVCVNNPVNHEVTNSTACIDGYIQGGQHWCKSDLKDCDQFTMESRLPGGISSKIIPVTYQGTPPPGVTPKGVCHHGQYLDQTNGIFTCRDAHKTHELSPNVKLLNNQWQRAW